MRQVGRELEGEQRVVERQVSADILTQHRVSGQLQQSAVVFRELELTGRAQHAEAVYAAQLADLDGERFAVFTGGQFGADHGARHLDAHARIGRTANDVEQSALPHVHLTHAQLVGVRVLNGFLDFTDHDAGERRRHRLELFHFQTGHGQGVCDLLGAQGRVAEFAQPGFWKLHG